MDKNTKSILKALARACLSRGVHGEHEHRVRFTLRELQKAVRSGGWPLNDNRK